MFGIRDFAVYSSLILAISVLALAAKVPAVTHFLLLIAAMLAFVSISFLLALWILGMEV